MEDVQLRSETIRFLNGRFGLYPIWMRNTLNHDIGLGFKKIFLCWWYHKKSGRRKA